MTTCQRNRQELPRPVSERVDGCMMRWCLLAFGCANIGLGVVGIFLPGLPTTVFLLIAFWAFSKSSERFQVWLWTHPRLGRPIRDWHQHQVIPLKAKMLAASMMSLSFIYVAFFIADSWVLPTVMAAVMVPSALYVLTRASEPPQVLETVPVKVNRR